MFACIIGSCGIITAWPHWHDVGREVDKYSPRSKDMADEVLISMARGSRGSEVGLERSSFIPSLNHQERQPTPSAINDAILGILYCTTANPLPYHPWNSPHPTLAPFRLMSHSRPMASSSSNQVSNFQLIINNALDEYKKRTKEDLRAHPLVTELQSCNTPTAILSVLQRQVQLDESRRSDDRWTRWLDPTVNVLFTLSATLGEGVGLVCVRA